MEQLRVPTVSLAAEIRYFDERPLTGRIFLPAMAERHEGPMRPEEWLNRPAPFFPFLREGAERTVILNKRYVVVLSLERRDYSDQFGVKRHIVVECGTLRTEGRIYIDMPEYASRLLDWVNRPEPFLAVNDDDRVHLIQKNRITFLSEVDKE